MTLLFYLMVPIAVLITPTIDTIPFTLTPSHNISIECVLNKMDTLNLMFHTDASSIALTRKSTENLGSIVFDNTVDATGWGGAGRMRYSKNNSLSIGRFNWDKLTIAEDTHSGHGTDGKFGPSLFKNKVVEIDFDKSILIIHSRLPEIPNDFEKRDLIFKQRTMYLKGVCKIGKVEYENQFMIHSGYSGTILLDDEFVLKNEISDQLPIIRERELKDSFGNIVKTKKALLPTFEFGKTNFSNMPIGFFEGSIGRQKRSVLGADILKRFNIILDLQKAEIYMKPNGLIGLPFSEV